MAETDSGYTKEDYQKIRRLQEKRRNGNATSAEIEVLDDLEDEGIIPKRTKTEIFIELTSGQQGDRNAQTAGTIGMDVAGATAAGEAYKWITKNLRGFQPNPRKLLINSIRGLGAAGANYFGSQGGIQDRPPEDRSLTEAGISGLAEPVGPMVGSGLVKTAKTVATPFQAAGDFFRRLIGKSEQESTVAKEAGEFLEKEAANIRTGKTPIDPEDFSESTLKRIEKSGGKDATLFHSLSRRFKSRWIELMDGIATPSLLGQQTMNNLATASQEILENSIGQFYKQFSSTMSPGDLAPLLHGLVKQNVEYFDRIRLANFAKLDIIADGVNLKYGKEWLPFKGVDLSILGRNTPVTFEKAAALAEKASPSNAILIKRKMFDAVKKIDKARNKPSGVSGNPTRAGLSEAQEDTLFEKLTSKPYNYTDAEATFAMKDFLGGKETLTKALAFSEKNAKLFKDTAIRDLARKNPEAFLDELFKSGRPDTIKSVMKMTNEAGEPILTKEMKTNIRAAFLGTMKRDPNAPVVKGLLERASERVGGVNRISGKRLTDEIDKFEGTMGEKTSFALFPGVGLKPLKRLASFLEVQQQGLQDKTGAMSFILQAPSAISDVARSSLRLGGAVAVGGGLGYGAATDDYGAIGFTMAGAGAILYSPKQMAQFLNNPKTLDVLLNGIKKRMHDPSRMRSFFTTFGNQLAAEGTKAIFIPDNSYPAIE